MEEYYQIMSQHVDDHVEQPELRCRVAIAASVLPQQANRDPFFIKDHLQQYAQKFDIKCKGCSIGDACNAIQVRELVRYLEKRRGVGGGGENNLSRSSLSPHQDHRHRRRRCAAVG